MESERKVSMLLKLRQSISRRSGQLHEMLLQSQVKSGVVVIAAGNRQTLLTLERAVLVEWWRGSQVSESYRGNHIWIV